VFDLSIIHYPFTYVSGNPTLTPYSPAVIRLLQGIVYEEDQLLWDLIITYQADIKQYLQVLGLEAFIDESEGYAFVKQKVAQSEEDGLPVLVKKIQLSYPVTLLCVLLREKLLEFDAQGGDSSRLIVSREQIKEMIITFLPEKSNEASIIDKIDANINKLVEYNFLRRLSPQTSEYEVKRILKARITVDTLQEIKQKLYEYAASL
jgi:tRNA(Ile)-lysidine synthase TilS/MesJ